jgi:hypothetical protein
VDGRDKPGHDAVLECRVTVNKPATHLRLSIQNHIEDCAAAVTNR